MKAAVFAASLALAFLVAGTLRAAEAWQEFRSPEGKFIALFPGKPKITHEAPDKQGATSHDFLVDEGATAYLVGYTDFPPGVFGNKTMEQVLDQQRDNLVEGTALMIRVDKPIKNAGQPGREVVIEDPTGFTQRLSIFLVGSRLYEVISGGPKGHDTSPAANRFHGSFQLTIE
jgi:hypothetical protein